MVPNCTGPAVEELAYYQGTLTPAQWPYMLGEIQGTYPLDIHGLELDG